MIQSSSTAAPAGAVPANTPNVPRAAIDYGPVILADNPLGDSMCFLSVPPVPLKSQEQILEYFTDQKSYENKSRNYVVQGTIPSVVMSHDEQTIHDFHDLFFSTGELLQLFLLLRCPRSTLDHLTPSLTLLPQAKKSTNRRSISSQH